MLKRATKNGAARRMTRCADFVAEVGDGKKEAFTSMS